MFGLVEKEMVRVRVRGSVCESECAWFGLVQV